MPIILPPLDIARIAAELEAQQEAVEEELRRLEEAKHVSQETMQRAIGPNPTPRR